VFLPTDVAIRSYLSLSANGTAFVTRSVGEGFHLSARYRTPSLTLRVAFENKRDGFSAIAVSQPIELLNPNV